MPIIRGDTSFSEEDEYEVNSLLSPSLSLNVALLLTYPKH